MTNMQVGGRVGGPPDWRMTRGGMRFRTRVIDSLSHETFRRMLRETYPAVLPPRSSGWWERFGHEVEVAGHLADTYFAVEQGSAPMAASWVHIEHPHFSGNRT